ncbi:TetR/AcrR family transcriptional regulator [Paenibacillus hamazuiensis]|uniref:TetR/AcrR family transcriptional regulator n=1 Tax=Paenibacillus hamazuiensis TaxID=2936508 RepID=UPI00200BBBF0|nr:TetR/AcrR family transcriptional regulator [Paenibacillus hamazuiensis]
MTSGKIRETALRHFAKNGYEGASLADISAEVGIKKQSIYAHYKGKDDLFLAVFSEVAAKELQFVEAYLKQSGGMSPDKLLLGFLLGYKERYEQRDDTKFFLRMAFFPPGHLQREIVEYGNQYLDQLELLLMPIFAAAARSGQIHPDVSIERAAAAFTAVMDGMFVEMLYGGLERSMKRLDASWFIFWRGIQNIKEGHT